MFDDGDSSHDQFLVEFLACDDIFVRDNLALHSDLKLTAQLSVNFAAPSLPSSSIDSKLSRFECFLLSS